MAKMILISHGKLSEGMAYSAQMIAGQNPDLSYYGLMPGGEVNKDVIEPVLAQVQAQPEEQFIIISDLYCGSVFNASYPLQKEKNVLIATGMNLSLVLTLLIGLSGGYTKESFAEAVNSSKEYTMVMPELAEDSTDDKEDFF